jgi:hypothetical protein
MKSNSSESVKNVKNACAEHGKPPPLALAPLPALGD